MVTAKQAKEIADALALAGAQCDLLQLSYEMLGRAREWDRASDMAEDYPDDSSIELVSSVQPGMFVLSDDGPLRIIRVLNGGLSLHLESDRSPAGTYRNYMHPTSPVVVKA